MQLLGASYCSFALSQTFHVSTLLIFVLLRALCVASTQMYMHLLNRLCSPERCFTIALTQGLPCSCPNLGVDLLLS